MNAPLPLSAARRYAPIEDASAWKGQALQQSTEWLHSLSADNLRDLDAALAQWNARGLPRTAMRVADFPLPSLSAPMGATAQAIESGRGFALIRGLPLDRWSAEEADTAYWGLSLYLGEPTSQNARGDVLVPVADAGVPKTDINWRAYFGNAQLHFHSDFTDVVGLMCVRPALSGGVSRIISATTLFNTLLAEAPELVDVFYDGFHFDRKGEEPTGVPPVTAEPIPMLSWYENRLSFRFIPAFAEAAARRRGVPLTPLQVEAIRKVDEIGNRPALHLDMNFQVGDVQFLNNYTVHHSRTQFEDAEAPEKKRLLKRIWLCTTLGRPLAPGFGDLYGPGSARLGVPRSIGV